jgi:hypothetical protein
MRAGTKLIALLISWHCIHGISAAIDYAPSWEFSESIAEQTPAAFLAKDFLIYDSSTGSLVYAVGASGKWSPPDIGSKSGLLDISVTLQAVPLWGTPSYHVGESFEGTLIPGSNAIRINFDRLSFWPWTSESTFVLQSHGLDHVPTAYSYGRVLPAGLTHSFLESELYAVTFPGSLVELQVVPEPIALALFATAALFVRAFYFRAGR